ncbi:uncharacterized protein VTP21DRAFT_7839 [Calcarisporiella thermophila]|uniref:uncharacterized protein n=1 Tax=Calcarisporiella thermophila TaxID=911321 RepID=UPI0037443143
MALIYTSRESSDDPERQALLNTSKPERKALSRISISILGVLIFIATATFVTIYYTQYHIAPKHKHNVILLISDGHGPTSQTYGRYFYQHINGLPYTTQLPLDTILVGTSRTRSSSSLVTDSAAGATAFSCALKTYNGAVAVDPQSQPCGTVLESAKANGYRTGLVVTSRITHATPAAFSAHVIDRNMEDKIAEHQIGETPLGRTVDLMFGGGLCFFLPNNSSESCRKDDRDLIAEAQHRGFSTLTTRADFDTVNVNDTSLPLIGIFALDHMAYEIDRLPAKEPSLYEMTAKALQILDKSTADSDKGFFLMIEGSKIDLAAHANDPAAQAHDILMYNEVIGLVKTFADTHPGTSVISISDHETGGMTLGRQPTKEYPEYIWYPEVIARVKNSTEVLTQAILKHRGTPYFAEYVRNTIVRDGLGIQDPSDEELEALMAPGTRFELEDTLGRMVSNRAWIGWTTHGHTGVDVNLYAYGAGAETLRGNHENTDIGEFIAQYLGLNLNQITQQLRVGNMSYISEDTVGPTTTKSSAADQGLDYYHSRV